MATNVWTGAAGDGDCDNPLNWSPSVLSKPMAEVLINPLQNEYVDQPIIVENNK